jgi:cyclopropane-fatty-acyl-phospholipid synthase
MSGCGSGCSRTHAAGAKNIAYHYDLGNDFYRLWLDETMTYSSAIFDNPQESLEAAQRRKYASMVDQMGARGRPCAGDRLRLGRALPNMPRERGLRVTGLTISQGSMTLRSSGSRGRGCRTGWRSSLQDYRDERGSYDGIASIEMFEAVGERYWPVYFDSGARPAEAGAERDLADHHRGRGPLADVPARASISSRNTSFRAACCPRLRCCGPRWAGGHAGQGDSIEFGESYSLTLRRWHEVFTARWDEVKRLGFDERFKRMWDFYLASCAGAFQGGNCDVTQITVTRPS